MKAHEFKERFKEVTENGKARILHFEEEARHLWDRWIERGREGQAETMKKIEEIIGRAPLVEKVREAEMVHRVQEFRHQFEERFEVGMDKVFDAMGVATKHDIERLERRLRTLSGKVNKLKETKAKATKTAARKTTRKTRRK